MRVIVTGASRGVGAGIATALGKADHAVGLLARSEDGLQRVKEAIEAHGGTAAAASADLRDAESTRHGVGRLAEALGGIDALVNNAGMVLRKSALEITLEEWHDQIATNVHGVFHATRAVLPTLRDQGWGHVVNISSISGYMPLAGGSGYAASKYAVTGFSESLFQEVRDYGVKVTTVFPGSVHTDTGDAPWKVQPEEVGQAVAEALQTRQAMVHSRVEIRQVGRPPKR